MKSALIFMVVLGSSFGGNFPSDWKSCKGITGRELNYCLKAAVEDVLPKLKYGVPSLKVPALEPLVIPRATIEAGNAVVYAVQKYKNYSIFGMSTAEISKVEATITSDGVTIKMDTFMSELQIKAEYDLKGNIYVLPIFGNGTLQVVLKNVAAKVKFITEKFKKNDVEYLTVTNYKVDLVPEKVTYNLDNLFNGNVIFGRIINQLLNDNWKEVYDDIEEGYIKFFETVTVDYMNKIFHSIPYEQLL